MPYAQLLCMQKLGTADGHLHFLKGNVIGECCPLVAGRHNGCKRPV